MATETPVGSIRVATTTDGFFIAGDGASGKDIRIYNKDCNYVDCAMDSVGEISGELDKRTTEYKKIVNKFNQSSEYTDVDTILGHSIVMNKRDFNLYIYIDDKYEKVTPDITNKLKAQSSVLEKIKIDAVTSHAHYVLGDRVMLYGPTGSGKTYEFLSTVGDMKAKGEIDDFTILTITEGLEDIDFLAHIVPGVGGKALEYVENHIVTLLRRAAGGEKVAILLDELNRGGKSFLNLILKLLDAVDGKNYVLHNFIKDENIVIPIENVLFFATMNLGGKYVGTNVLDEALFDRFNIVSYKGYNLEVEDSILANFDSYSDALKKIVSYIREIHKDGEIRSPISTRGLKMWAERFINSPKNVEDVMQSFQITLMHRLVSVDDFGNPNEEEIAIIINKFKELKFIS